MPPKNSLNNPKINMQLKASIEALLTDRPIAYHAVLAKALGSASAGILLSQLLYWTPRSRDVEGWIWKTRDEIFEETALTRYEQESARKALRDAGVLMERLAGMPARKYFRVKMDRLTEVLAEYYQNTRPRPAKGAANLGGGNQPTGRRNSHQHANPSPTNMNAENQPTATIYTETTSKNTATGGSAVASLKEFGISDSAAHRIAESYSVDYIFDKIAQTRWLLENQPGAVRKNIAGYLRRAIEEDYAPPLSRPWQVGA